VFTGFSHAVARSFDTDGECRVSSPQPVWFRNGGYAPHRHFTEISCQSKIYTESIQSDFPQIFGDLTSMQTLALYRRLLVRD
jgi:hypothetical protein